jgi:hypothetical protein
MIFKDLIKELKKVKTEKDITPDLSFELTAAAIASHMQNLEVQYNDIDPEEVFDMTRSIILKQLDGYLIDLIMDNDDLDNELDIKGNNPMNDPILNSAIQKAMDEYNNRLEKKPNMKKV